MAESFIFNIAQKLLEKVGSLVYREICLLWGVSEDLRRLERTLAYVKAVLLDAEEKQEHNHALHLWLGQLKDVFSVAEDVLDEFECEALRKRVVDTSGSTEMKVRHYISSSNPLSLSYRMGHKIREIRERLDDIAADKAKFHFLVENVVDRHMVHREMTHSFVDASDVIGRDNDKDRVVELLMEQGDDNNNNNNKRTVSVIPLVGIGGMGKTTLAKLVFNDERIVENFELKMWVCVSEDFDLKQLLVKMIKSVCYKNFSDLDVDQLQIRLRAALNGRKFLLVLDDVWNEELSKWIELRDLLRGAGAKGSKILVTTRSNSIASIMSTDGTTYILEGLSEDDCLSLLVKWAFKEGEEKKHPKLVKIGSEIVKKCGGFPLAVRTLGNVLFSKTNVDDWILVRDNEIWKLGQEESDIVPALKLSYDQMPSFLKQCFACCSLFPKGYEFTTTGLVDFWKAHGLVQSPNENHDHCKDMGIEYINELWSRSFFVDFSGEDDHYKFKLHDLVHDLAVYVSKGECLMVESTHVRNISRKVRHLSFLINESNFDDLTLLLPKFESLRTIIFPIDGVGTCSASFLHSCVVNSKSLHVLDISDSTFEELPQFISKMKHLRYLDLSRNKRIKKLPDFICKLQSLQVLRLVGCVELEEFPRNMGNLLSLRVLEITTKKAFLPEKIFSSLCSLESVCFSACDNLEYLFDMQRLTNLSMLTITKCGSLKCLPHGVKHLTALQKLRIFHCEKLDLHGEAEGDNHQCLGVRLRELALVGLPKLVELPPWLQQSTNTLESINLVSCRNFTTLPEWLSDFTSLRKLQIFCSPQMLSLPDGMHRVTSLKKLIVAAGPEFCSRYQEKTGPGWLEIAHVPSITIGNFNNVEAYSDTELEQFLEEGLGAYIDLKQSFSQPRLGQKAEAFIEEFVKEWFNADLVASLGQAFNNEVVKPFFEEIGKGIIIIIVFLYVIGIILVALVVAFLYFCWKKYFT
ncbi:Disease resistance protein [Quillaja saponaria]|uniref:Disease resistance protein n=1 Tax=Quillaja saponaria TaxID=32244 RepID=A0AAD7VI93_QUISA|nr:Disease resistance protein [Quillaja saponaria]